MINHDINPREIADKWLKGLDFPADKNQAIHQAEQNDASQHLIDILGKIKDKQYKNMGERLESVGDVTWDHD